MLLLLPLPHTFFTHCLSSNYHVAWLWGQRHSLTQNGHTQEYMKTNGGKSSGGQLGGSNVKKMGGVSKPLSIKSPPAYCWHTCRSIMHVAGAETHGLCISKEQVRLNGHRGSHPNSQPQGWQVPGPCLFASGCAPALWVHTSVFSAQLRSPSGPSFLI